MHFAFFGLSLTSSWGNGHATTYRGLLRGLRQRGHQIDFFERDTDWYARHRDLPQPTQARLHLYRDWNDIRASALATARAADAVIVGSYFPDGIPLLDDLLGHTPAPVCFYDIDTPITLEQLRGQHCAYLRADQIPALDLYLSFTGGPMLAELQRTWHAQRVRTLYCACDESAYRSASRSPHPPVALSFMGTFAPDRQSKFQRLLLAPARHLPRMLFHVAGSMFPQPQTWPGNVRYDAHLAPDQHATFYAASRFTLNLTRQAMVEAGYSPSVRLFEAAAAATAIISDPWPGLSEFFQPSSEILVADNTVAIVQALVHTSQAAAAALGRAAQQRVLEAHTSAHRATALESYLERLRHPELARDATH